MVSYGTGALRLDRIRAISSKTKWRQLNYTLGHHVLNHVNKHELDKEKYHDSL